MNVLFEVVGVLAKGASFVAFMVMPRCCCCVPLSKKLLKSVMDYSAVHHYILGLLPLAG